MYINSSSKKPSAASQILNQIHFGQDKLKIHGKPAENMVILFQTIQVGRCDYFSHPVGNICFRRVQQRG